MQTTRDCCTTAKKLRFEAYEAMGDMTEMIDLSFEFALKGEEECYVKLKLLGKRY